MTSTEGNPPREVVMFGKEAFSDVTLAVGHKDFKVHKLTLTLMSDYFEALFYGNFKEKDQDRIELEADPVAFERMLTFIYDRDFGDETFLKCLVVEQYSLYEVLERFDVKKSTAKFWEVWRKWRCPSEKKGGIPIIDCEHCLNGPLIYCIYNGEPGITRHTGRAVKAWMEKYKPIVPQIVYSVDNALPKIIKEMVI